VVGRSLGRTSSPSEEAMRRARSPSSSITLVSHWTADFSAFPFDMFEYVIDCMSITIDVLGRSFFEQTIKTCTTLLTKGPLLESSASIGLA
jgi:hypothetical protein